MEKPVRLDKFLADAGAGTRSEVKKYIQKGQVQVNGKSVKKPELKVTEEDQVVMNGQEIHAAPEYVYYLFNKPAGCVSATEDSRDKTVLDYIEEKDRRKGLFPVGRLDSCRIKLPPHYLKNILSVQRGQTKKFRSSSAEATI